MPENALFTRSTESDTESLLHFQHPAWSQCDRAVIDRDWRGRSMLTQKGHLWQNLTQVASLWNRRGLFLYFECWFDSLNLNLENPPHQHVDRLWETDVVEVFVRPDSCEDYFELEISPIGQWLDAHILKPRVDVDFRWSSEVRLGCWIDHGQRIWRTVAMLPFAPLLEASGLAREPSVGDAWRLNFFRMAGKGEEREFLAWRPTFTRRPDYHVPSSFGTLLFLDKE